MTQLSTINERLLFTWKFQVVAFACFKAGSFNCLAGVIAFVCFAYSMDDHRHLYDVAHFILALSFVHQYEVWLYKTTTRLDILTKRKNSVKKLNDGRVTQW